MDTLGLNMIIIIRVLNNLYCFINDCYYHIIIGILSIIVVIINVSIIIIVIIIALIVIIIIIDIDTIDII